MHKVTFIDVNKNFSHEQTVNHIKNHKVFSQQNLEVLCTHSKIKLEEIVVQELAGNDLVIDEKSLLTAVTLLDDDCDECKLTLFNPGEIPETHYLKKGTAIVFLCTMIPLLENKQQAQIAVVQARIIQNEHTKSFNFQQIIDQHINYPMINDMNVLFKKFSHDFDDIILREMENICQISPKKVSSENYLRVSADELIDKGLDVHTYGPQISRTMRSTWFHQENFYRIRNNAIASVASGRKTSVNKDSNGNIDYENVVLFTPFALHINHKVNGKHMQVSKLIPYKDHRDVWITLSNNCGSGMIVGLVLYLPINAPQVAVNIAATTERKFSVYEHEILPGEAVFISDGLEYEFLHFDEDTVIHGFNLFVLPVDQDNIIAGQHQNIVDLLDQQTKK